MSKQSHSEQGDNKRKRLQQLTVQLIAKQRKCEARREHTCEQHAARNRAPRRPSSEENSSDVEEAATADKGMLKTTHVHNQVQTPEEK